MQRSPDMDCRSRRYFLLAVRLDVVDRFLDAGDLLGVLVGNLDPELLFERHDEFHRVERVGAEVVDERRIRRHFFFVHAQLLHDDALDLVGYRHSILQSKTALHLAIWLPFHPAHLPGHVTSATATSMNR